MSQNLVKPLYPIGSQSFGEIRSNGYLYVDKTGYIPLLLTSGKYKFLSRPRRFGKSLLISMLECFFRGKRELFSGLAIDSLMPEDWETYPVLHIDLSGENYESSDVLLLKLNNLLKKYEDEIGLSDIDASLSERLGRLIRSFHEFYGKKVVVLIDEYDNPITSVIDNDKLESEMRNILYGFYSILKNMDDHLHFCMLTGVTKYGKLSVFSGLNNLNDISFDDEFAGICGVTEDEIHMYLHVGVAELAINEGVTIDKAYELLKENYDGYYFSASMLDVYNPFSLICALAKRKISGYWFASGTPGILIRLLRNRDIDIKKTVNTYVSLNEIDNISSISVDITALFYHTGYLTFKEYLAEDDLYLVGFPNKEVERGFNENLLRIYTDTNRTAALIHGITGSLEKGGNEEHKPVDLVK